MILIGVNSYRVAVQDEICIAIYTDYSDAVSSSGYYPFF